MSWDAKLKPLVAITIEPDGTKASEIEIEPVETWATSPSLTLTRKGLAIVYTRIDVTAVRSRRAFMRMSPEIVRGRAVRH